MRAFVRHVVNVVAGNPEERRESPKKAASPSPSDEFQRMRDEEAEAVTRAFHERVRRSGSWFPGD